MDDEIILLRGLLADGGNESHTSPRFQDDLLHATDAAAPYGTSFIEVGCHHGGLSAQLALQARRHHLHLHVIDIDQGYLDHARHVVETLVGPGYASFHLTDLAGFTARHRDSLFPALAFLDGDHTFDGVVKDIDALLSLHHPPFAIAFHDYSLRYATPEGAKVRVDKAIADRIGAKARLRPIGEVAGEGPFLGTTPGEGGHYHEPGCPEGVLIEAAMLVRP